MMGGQPMNTGTRDRTVLAIDPVSNTWAVVYDGQVKEAGALVCKDPMAPDYLLAPHNQALTLIADYAPDLAALAAVRVSAENLARALLAIEVQAAVSVAAAALLEPENVLYVELRDDGPARSAAVIGLAADDELVRRSDVVSEAEEVAAKAWEADDGGY
jgi:hypothetical protein